MTNTLNRKCDHWTGVHETAMNYKQPRPPALLDLRQMRSGPGPTEGFVIAWGILDTDKPYGPDNAYCQIRYRPGRLPMDERGIPPNIMNEVSLFECKDQDHAYLIMAALRAHDKQGRSVLFDTLYTIMFKKPKQDAAEAE
jgi:hypothetical protein